MKVIVKFGIDNSFLGILTMMYKTITVNGFIVSFKGQVIKTKCIANEFFNKC